MVQLVAFEEGTLELPEDSVVLEGGTLKLPEDSVAFEGGSRKLPKDSVELFLELFVSSFPELEGS